MFRGNAAHTGVYPGVAPREFHRLKWKFPTGARVVGSPVIEDKVIYFGSDDGNVYAVDAESGQQIWKTTTRGPVPCTPAIDHGTVYVGSYDGKFYALDAQSGAVKWKFATEGERRFEAKGLHGRQPKNQTFADAFDVFLSSPAVVDGAVYFGSGDGNLYSLDANSVSCVGNSGPAMSCMHLPQSSMASPLSGAGTVISTRSMSGTERRSGAIMPARIRSFTTRSGSNPRPRSWTAWSILAVAMRSSTRSTPRPEKKSGNSIMR